MSSTRIFEHNNFGGRNVLIDNPGHQRYVLATFDFLNGLSFNDITSSLQMRSGTPTIPSSCLLFEDARFRGRFKSFAFNSARDVNALPDFNDLTSCVLLMDHDPNPNKSILAVRQLAGSRIDQAIDDQLAGISQVSRSGATLCIFTIDLFEVSRFGDDLMLAEVPIKVHTPWPFSDVDAKIRYWLKFFLDGDHHLRASVVAWGYWIAGSVLTGSIEGQLRPQVESHVGTVESQLNSMLTDLNFHRWTDVYLMPGQASVTSDYDGNVTDDCSLVLPFSDS